MPQNPYAVVLRQRGWRLARIAKLEEQLRIARKDLAEIEAVIADWNDVAAKSEYESARAAWPPLSKPKLRLRSRSPRSGG